MQEVLVDCMEGVMTLTLNRLDKKNAFNQAMYSAMTQALAQAALDSAVRVVVVQGHVTVFSAGNDIADFLAAAPSQDASRIPAIVFLRALATFSKPVVAAVCGPAVGIGCTLLFHCDLVYAADNAAFSMPFVHLGLCPEGASSLLVPQMLGYHRAAEALLLGEPFGAEAALEVGLANRVVPPMQAQVVAQAQARKLATRPLASLLETKRLMKQATLPAVLAALDEEAHSFSHLLQAPAAQEALSAFVDRRPSGSSRL